MSINYNIKADQILGILGYNQPAGEEFLNGFERENNVKLPLCLRNFYKVAYKCPLLSTADIWTDDMFFYYKQIKEEIEDFKKDYWDDPEADDEDIERTSFWKFLYEIPEEQWPEHVADYLEIGSDYAAGVVRYGICADDLDKEDPPVYEIFEDDELTEWKLLCNSLSEYFLMVICDVLLCTDYDTAGYILQENGWNYDLCSYDEIEETAESTGIDISRMKSQENFSRGKVTCGYDEERKMLIVVGIYEGDKYPFVVCNISKN